MTMDLQDSCVSHSIQLGTKARHEILSMLIADRLRYEMAGAHTMNLTWSLGTPSALLTGE